MLSSTGLLLYEKIVPTHVNCVRFHVAFLPLAQLQLMVTALVSKLLLFSNTSSSSMSFVKHKITKLNGILLNMKRIYRMAKILLNIKSY